MVEEEKLSTQPADMAPYRVRSFVNTVDTITVRVEQWDEAEGKNGAYVRMYGDRLNIVVTCPNFLERFRHITLEDKVKKAHASCRKECINLMDDFYRAIERREKISISLKKIVEKNHLS